MIKTNPILLAIPAIFIFFSIGCEKNSTQNANVAAQNTKVAVSEAANASPPITLTAAQNPNVTDTGAAGVTIENFNKLAKGMTVAEIKKIIGSDGKLISEGDNPGYKMSMYQWKNGKNNISCMFQNDKMISKTQFGL